ncbi:hypothetical protein MFIFM68171_01769 [Madurella fahalii]|uniref:Major facilitator superfamily (MFS) profile domain-containing protein n=1 Tax=Madurella fahalii TaxID=1157608 RepID=A0ABQ0G1D6_9PEZI
MARSATGCSVNPINTETDTETERTPLLAGIPTPTTTAPARLPALHTLLAPQDSASNDGDIDDDDDDGSSAGPDPVAHLRAVLRPRVTLLAFAIVFLVELGVGMVVPPANAIMESIICRQMHPEVFPPGLGPGPGFGTLAAATSRFAGGIVLTDDPACKTPDVQGYLAMLRGWASTFECIPGIVGAVPYGILSDRWGRKGVLGLSLLGIWVGTAFTYVVYCFSEVVPLRAVWFASAFQLVGGGGAVCVAMLYTLVADVVAVDERATVFLRLAAVFLAAQMVAGPLAGVMMVRDPWIPLIVALASLILANLAVLAVPETVHVHDRKQASSDQDGNGLGDGDPQGGKLWRKARKGLAEVWEFVFANKNLAVLMLSLVFVILGRFVGELLLQYATDRYGWTWSRASMVLSIHGGGSLVTLLVVLPVARWLCLQRLGISGAAKDLWLARWSGIAHIVGSLIIAAAANGLFFSFGLVWFALGSGISSLVRSLLNALVEERHVGTVNTLVGLMEMVGLAVAGPLLAKSLSVGLNLGGPWIGLPFITAGLFFMISTTILWAFRLPNGRRPPVAPSC